MRQLIKVVGPPLGMGLFGALLWERVNALATTNGVGILARQGWPLGNLWTFVVLGAILGIIIGRRLESSQKTYKRNLAKVGRRMGLTYFPSAEQLRDDHPGLDQMPLFRDWSSGANRLSGHVDGRAVHVFDYTAVILRDQNGNRVKRRTVVLLPGSGLPDFDLRPRTLMTRMLHGVGLEGMTFDAAGLGDPDDAAAIAKFNRLYLVAAPTSAPSSLGRWPRRAQRTTTTNRRSGSSSHRALCVS